MFAYAKTKAHICTADQRLCFRYSDGTTPLLLKSEISSFFSEAAQADFYQTEDRFSRVVAQM